MVIMSELQEYEESDRVLRTYRMDRDVLGLMDTLRESPESVYRGRTYTWLIHNALLKTYGDVADRLQEGVMV